jgi:uroporphyrinogen-III synthase
LLEARLGSELASLVRHYGGEPVCVPAVREAPIDCGAALTEFVEGLARGACDVLVLQTGVGTKLLLDEAARRGWLPQLLAALGGITVVVRGPKPSAALRERGVRAALTALTPYDTTALLEAMAGLDLAGKRVGVVHHGERNEPLVDAVRSREAEVWDIQLYTWLLPDDVEPLRGLVREIIAGRIGAVAFTTQVHARHLFGIAAEIGAADDLRRALTSHTVVASIGPTCTAALRSFGVKPQVEPARPKMRPMISALSACFERVAPSAVPAKS